MSDRKRILMLEYALGVGGGGMQAVRMADALSDEFDVYVAAYTLPRGEAAGHARRATLLGADIDRLLALSAAGRGSFDHIDSVCPLSGLHVATLSRVLAANPGATLTIRFHAEAAFINVWPTGGDRVLATGLLAQADALSFHHARMRDEILAGFGRLPGQCRERAVVVSPGIDIERFAPGGQDARAVAMYRDRFGLRGRMVVAMAGRPAPEKNWLDYVTICRRLKDRYGDQLVCLAVTGAIRGGHDGIMADLSRHNSALGAPVRVTGLLHDWENLLASVDVYVQTSCTESFCRTAAEAAATGVPVVATGVGGLAEIVVADMHNGFCVPPANGHVWLAPLANADRATFAHLIASLLDDPDRRRALGDNGRRRAVANMNDVNTLAAERSLIAGLAQRRLR